MEIKRTNRSIGIREVEKFDKIVSGLELSRNIQVKQKWYISHGGFSKKAVEYAKKMGILISDVTDIETIANAIKYRLKGTS